MAGREKDYELVGALISAAMVQPRIIEERLAMLSAEAHKVAIARARRFVQGSINTAPEGHQNDRDGSGDAVAPSNP